MDDTEKSFACTIEGCQMTFTNEDHLNWHHKKHDMCLSLGNLDSKSGGEIADQTPTPTRFIRNCEEVGLFQDLQNVNPFDETFKKAIESSKSGTTLTNLLQIPESNNEETLHTPHILPHVVEHCCNKFNTISNSIIRPEDNQSSSHSAGEFTIAFRNDNEEIENSSCTDNIRIDTIQNLEQNENLSYRLIVDTDNELSQEQNVAPKTVSDLNSNTDNNGESAKTDLKTKLKEVLKNKEKSAATNDFRNQPQIVISHHQNSQKRPKKIIVNTEHSSDSIEKIRAMNREAQLRCRQRRKLEMKKLMDDFRSLKSENQKLLGENLIYKHQFATLKSLILKKRQDNLTSVSLTDIERVFSNPTNEQITILSQDGSLLHHRNFTTTGPNVRPKLCQKPIRKKSQPNATALLMPLCQQQQQQQQPQKTIILQPQVPPNSMSSVQNQNNDNDRPVLIQVMGPVEQLSLSVLPLK